MHKFHCYIAQDYDKFGRVAGCLTRGLSENMGQQISTERPWHIDANGSLTLPLEVLQMPNGRIPIPDGTRKLYVEIGSNSFDTLADSPQLAEPHSYLVAFEPLVDKWAQLLARHTVTRKASMVLGQHHERGVTLPMAVSDKEGFAEFHVSPIDGCSSLRKFRQPDATGSHWASWIPGICKQVQRRRVPCVSLNTVLHEWLADRPVAFLKVDAQGHDLAIVRAAGREGLSTVEELSLEVIHDDCTPIYEGQPRCTEVVSTMLSLGFGATFACNQRDRFGQSGCEGNIRFKNLRGRPAPSVMEAAPMRSKAVERAVAERTAAFPAAKSGFCGATETTGSCDKSEKGFWDTRGSNGVSTLAKCVERCQACANCHFVSFSTSPKHNDCSWYRHCKMDELYAPPPTGLDYLSLRVKGKPGASGVATLQSALPPDSTRQFMSDA